MATFSTPAEVKAEIARITGSPVRTSGGKWGGKAAVDYRGRTYETRDERGVGFALTLLLNEVVDDTPADEPADERPTVDSVMEQVRILAGRDVDLRIPDEDEDIDPHPVWKDGVLMAIFACNGECMASAKDLCDCRCNGDNHGILFRLQGRPIVPVMYGDKQCLCGCGGTTKRRFVPGHDARYHAAQKRAAKEAAAAAQEASAAAFVAGIINQ